MRKKVTVRKVCVWIKSLPNHNSIMFDDYTSVHKVITNVVKPVDLKHENLYWMRERSLPDNINYKTDVTPVEFIGAGAQETINGPIMYKLKNPSINEMKENEFYFFKTYLGGKPIMIRAYPGNGSLALSSNDIKLSFYNMDIKVMKRLTFSIN